MFCYSIYALLCKFFLCAVNVEIKPKNEKIIGSSSLRLYRGLNVTTALKYRQSFLNEPI